MLNRHQLSDVLLPAEQFMPINYSLHKPSLHADSREGDWICVICNNLNFAFRSKCNRCKTQTKSLNEVSTSVYYLVSPYALLEGMAHRKQNTPNRSETLITKRDKIRASDKTPKKKAIKLELPSVSPLVKKYHSRVSKVLAEQTMNKCLFSNDTLWASIQLREQEDEAEVQQDVHDVLQQGGDLEKSIQRIIL